LKLELKSYGWLVKENEDVNIYKFPRFLHPEENNEVCNEKCPRVYYPIYFPIGILIKYMIENGFNIEIVY